MDKELLFNDSSLTKEGQAAMANYAIQSVLEGDINPVEAVVKLKSLQAVIDTVLKDPTIKGAVILEAEKYGKGETPSYKGATLQIKEAAVKYDFSDCGDPEWDCYDAMVRKYTERRKKREEFLKHLSEPTTIACQHTGEMVDIVPPSRSSITTFAITFKKS